MRRRRSGHRLPGRVPDAGDRVRRPQRSGTARCSRRKALAARLCAAGRAQHAAAHDLSAAHHQRVPRDRRRDRRHRRPHRAHDRAGHHARRPRSRRPGAARRYSDASITDKIADIVLRAARALGLARSASAVAGALTRAVPRRDQLPVRKRRRHLGRQPAGRVGLRASPTSSGGSASATPAPSSPPSCCCCASSWRTSINRFAEAMTIFAVAMAGLMPILHLGRPWFFYWLIPYPDIMNVWPQWRSPLVWDIFAIGTYLDRVAAVLVHGPDPRPRDAARPRAHALEADRVRSARARLARRGAALGALRHRLSADGGSRHAAGHLGAQRGVARFLVRHYAPGWHSTIFPPYFVAGALFSGFAMALTLAVPMRAVFRLKSFITARHLDNMAKLMLVMRPDRRLQLRRRDLHGVLQRRPLRDRRRRATAIVGPYAPVCLVA